jgi:hypothetical protein
MVKSGIVYFGFTPTLLIKTAFYIFVLGKMCKIKMAEDDIIGASRGNLPKGRGRHTIDKLNSSIL